MNLDTLFNEADFAVNDREDLFQSFADNPAEFTESDIFETYPEAQAVARLGFSLQDMARISIDEFSEYSDIEVDAAISEFLHDKTYSEQQEFWGALIKGAAKLILPAAKKLGGRLVKKIFKGTAIKAGKDIGKLVNRSIKNRPTLSTGKKKSKFSVFVSLLPQIIQQIQNLPESIYSSGESVSETELFNLLETLSDSVNHAMDQLMSTHESFGETTQNSELNEALQSLIG